MKKSIGKNALLNVIKQSLSILFPLISYPYVLRVLGSVGIGKVNYTGSIIRYFSILAVLGITSYAIREGAKIRDNPEKINQFISELFSINVLTTLLCYILLFFTLLFIPQLQQYRLLLLIQSLSIVFTTLGVDYINSIFEDYLYITIRSIVTHLAALILLFIIVKTPYDYYKYACISVITNGIICFSNWLYCRRYVSIRVTRHLNFRKHLKPMLVLFANTLAISVYVNIDTTMLGWIHGDDSVGLYTASVNVYSIIKGILAAIYVVAVPRLSYYLGKKDYSSYKKTSTDIFGYLTLLLIPICIGVICVAPDIMMFMGGKYFLKSVISLRVLGVALLFAIFGGYFTACLNITLGKERNTLIATVFGAILNIILNIFVIPRWSINGAAFTTLVSEAFVLVFCFISLKEKEKLFDYSVIRKTILDSILAGLSIIAITILIKVFSFPFYINLITIIILSIPLYFLVLKCLKSPLVSGLLTMLKQKISITK